MKKKKILSGIMLSSWFLAFFPALLATLFLPELGNKYSLKVEEIPKHLFPIIYADLNGDKFTERILAGKSAPPYTSGLLPTGAGLAGLALSSV